MSMPRHNVLHSGSRLRLRPKGWWWLYRSFVWRVLLWIALIWTVRATNVLSDLQAIAQGNTAALLQIVPQSLPAVPIVIITLLLGACWWVHSQSGPRAAILFRCAWQRIHTSPRVINGEERWALVGQIKRRAWLAQALIWIFAAKWLWSSGVWIYYLFDGGVDGWQLAAVHWRMSSSCGFGGLTALLLLQSYSDELRLLTTVTERLLAARHRAMDLCAAAHKAVFSEHVQVHSGARLSGISTTQQHPTPDTGYWRIYLNGEVRELPEQFSITTIVAGMRQSMFLAHPDTALHVDAARSALHLLLKEEYAVLQSQPDLLVEQWNILHQFFHKLLPQPSVYTQLVDHSDFGAQGIALIPENVIAPDSEFLSLAVRWRAYPAFTECFYSDIASIERNERTVSVRFGELGEILRLERNGAHDEALLQAMIDGMSELTRWHKGGHRLQDDEPAHAVPSEHIDSDGSADQNTQQRNEATIV